MRAPDVIVLGSINIDIVLRVARFPSAGETVVGKSAARHAGGKGANQAVSAARAGAKVAMVGAVGDDADGAHMRETLEREGIDCAAVRIDADTATGTAHILVDDAGENQIVVLAGANRAIELPAPRPAAVYLCQLETPVDAVAAFLRGRPASAIAILNAAPFCSGADALFASAGIVIVNETELAAYARAKGGLASETGTVDLARQLLTHDAQQIIVTLGKAGSVLVGRDHVAWTSTGRVEVVDTTGAGDCFCGYLAANLALGQSLAASIAIAHRAAGLAVGRAGAQASIPMASECDRVIGP